MKATGVAACLAEGCDRKYHAKGYCCKHWHQISRHGRLTPEVERMSNNENILCSVENCNSKTESKGLCTKHYLQLKRKGCIQERTSIDKNEIIKCGEYAEVFRFLASAETGVEVDHKNNNCLDNRKNNLRFCNRAQNTWNTRIRSDNSSGVKGVSFWKKCGMWSAEIQVNGKRIKLGFSKDMLEVIKLRKDAEIKYFGEFNNKQEVV
jgi:hypothetical protein